MKNFKNLLLAGATALATVVAPTMNVFAQEVTGTTDPTSATTDVKYLVEDSYKWSIHSEIDFGKNAGINQHVAKEGNKVEVTENLNRYMYLGTVHAERKKAQITLPTV